MRTASPATGSISDRINAIAIQVKGLRDLADAEHRFPALSRSLASVADRVGTIRARGGPTASVAGPLDWLDEVIADHPALSGPDGQNLREEFTRLAQRVRRVGGV